MVAAVARWRLWFGGDFWWRLLHCGACGTVVAAAQWQLWQAGIEWARIAGQAL